MNKRMITYVLGRVLLVVALLMLVPVLVGLLYRERASMAFFPSVLLAALGGAAMFRRKPENAAIYAREGFCIVAASWVLISLLGALPFCFAGLGISFWDSVFETVSGFTTTGASILARVEWLPKCLLFWRSFTHWIGGMGVLVFILAVAPLEDNRSLLLMRAEVPGPEVGKLVPRMRDTAKILYGVYSVMTVILIALLLLGGMDPFDACCNAFGTAGTGGFSVRDAGIAYYDSAYVEVVLSVFMLLFGVNFNLYHLILIGRGRAALRNEELRWYVCIVAAAVAVVAAFILRQYGTVGEALRYSLFQVSSIITTTGFATADYAGQWPQITQHVLVLLMIIGACAGSTGGGVKVSRVIILVKGFRTEVRRMIHPRMVSSIQVDGKAVSRETIQSVRVYFSIYMLIVLVSTLLLSLDGMDLTTNLTAELSCFNNIGPGLGAVGPMGNFSAYSPFSKMLLSLNMLLGRLEIFPMLVLLSPSIWRKTSA